jgi:hypothetical protein
MPKLRIGGAPRDSYQRMSLPVADIIATQTSLLNARADFLAAGDVKAATGVALIFDRFVERIRRVADRTAALAEQEIVAAIDASRVRPDTARGQRKLRDVIVAEAWDPTPNIVSGTVSIGIHEVLDKLPYWRVQEYGHRYAHSPKGFFMGPGYQGASLPNPAMFRVHPLFVPSGKGRKFRRPPVVKARHFLRDGTDKAIAYWRAETRAADVQAATELNRLVAGLDTKR